MKFQKPAAERKGLKLLSELDPSLPECEYDSDALTQVLNNLISNAVKYTKQGKIIIRSISDEGRIKIVVSDTGRGIDKDQLDRLFLPFERIEGQSDKAVGGTGLGLAITKEIIELHGGRIWVESETGKGTDIWLEMPMLTASSTHIKATYKKANDR